MTRNRRSIYIGMLLSGILILGFGTLQQKESKFLKLPAQWIAIATLPTVIALFTEGYILRFKGFGVELESAIKAPINTINIYAADALSKADFDEKKSESYLQQISTERRQQIRRLSVDVTKKAHYQLSVLNKYFNALPNLDYLEVKYNSRIQCLLPMSVFQSVDSDTNVQFNNESLNKFIEALEKGNVRDAFPEDAITLTVRSDQSLIDVLKKMRFEESEIAAVVSPKHKYLGVVYARDVEQRIANSVLESSNN